jgi:hypothetical protein
MSTQVTDFKEVQSQLDHIGRVDAAMSIQAAVRGAQTRKDLRQSKSKPEVVSPSAEDRALDLISSNKFTVVQDKNDAIAQKEELLKGEVPEAAGEASSSYKSLPGGADANVSPPDEDDLEPLASTRDVMEEKQQNASILEENDALEQSVKLSAGAKPSFIPYIAANDSKTNTATWPEVEESFQLPGGTPWPLIEGCSDSDVFSWVHETNQVFVRLVTWNLMSSLPSSVREVQKKLLPKNK